MKKKHWIASFVALFVIVFGGRELSRRINPFPEVVFLESEFGHTSLFREFKPVLATDPTVSLGRAHAAQDGVLRFYDWDGDGRKDAVVETPDLWLDFGEYRTSSRHVMSYHWDAESGRPVFKTIFSEKAPSSQSWLKDDG